MGFEQWLDQYGWPLATLAIVIGTGARKVWVWGWALRDAEAREASWKEIALKALNVAEKQ